MRFFNLLFIIGCLSIQFSYASDHDTLTYHYKEIDKVIKQTKSLGENPTSIFIKYPVFNSYKIDRYILSKMVEYEDAEAKSPQDIVKIFQDRYASRRSRDKIYSDRWNKEIVVEVIDQQGSLISFVINKDSYMGGPRGYSSIYYFNYDINSDREIELEDIFAKEDLSELKKIGERLFKAEPDMGQQIEAYFGQENFELSDNFLIHYEGITFYYFGYKIDQPGELLIPLAKFKSLLKINSILADYYKMQ